MIAVLCILFAQYGFPVLTYDAQCFLPAAAAVKNGNGLVNEFYNAGFIPGGKFLFYPPLFPVIMSVCMYGSGAAAIYNSILLINILSIVVVLLIFKKMAGRYSFENKPQWVILLFVVFWLPANCTFIIPNNSRPELVCRLLLSLLLLLHLSTARLKYLLSGVIYACAFLTSPIFGIYLSALVLLYVIYQNSFKGLVAFIAGGLVVLSLFLALYPYTISELLATMKIHSNNVIFERNEGFSVKNFLTYHVFANNASFGFVLFAGAATAAFINFSPSRLKHRFGFRFILAGLIGMVLYFSLKNLPMSYYMYVLAPLFLFLIAHAWFTTNSKFARIAITVLVMLVSVSFIRLCYSFIANANKTQYSLASVNTAFEKYRQLKGTTIGLSNGLWPFFAGTKECTAVIYDGIDDKKADYIIQQQYATGKTAPAAIANYELVEHFFDENQSALAKMTANKYAPFYQYAVYKRK